MKKYIIDIYRGEKDKPRSLVGVIGEVGLKGRKGFTNFDELWEILNPVDRTRNPQAESRDGVNGTQM